MPPPPVNRFRGTLARRYELHLAVQEFTELSTVVLDEHADLADAKQACRSAHLFCCLVTPGFGHSQRMYAALQCRCRQSEFF